MFKKGDFIICTVNMGALTQGKIYVAEETLADESGAFVKVVNDEGNQVAIYDFRFVLATKENLINYLFKPFLEKSLP